MITVCHIEVFIPPATQIALSALAFVLLIAFVRVGCRRYDGGESEAGHNTTSSDVLVVVPAECGYLMHVPPLPVNRQWAL